MTAVASLLEELELSEDDSLEDSEEEEELDVSEEDSLEELLEDDAVELSDEELELAVLLDSCEELDEAEVWEVESSLDSSVTELSAVSPQALKNKAIKAAGKIRCLFIEIPHWI